MDKLGIAGGSKVTSATKWFLGNAILGLALLGNACSDPEQPPPLGADPSTPVTRFPKPSSAWEPVPCWIDAPAGYEMQCGRVKVPETPGAPAGPTVSLAVAQIFNRSTQPAPDPAVYLEGGPGGAALQTLVGQFDGFAPIAEQRDWVVFDQRGAGFSEPSLSCAQENRDAVDPTGIGSISVLRQCRERLVRQGVNLAAFNTRTIAADSDAVRRALGYAQWNLYGISYGTRLALTVLRDHPEGIRSAVIDSVLPLEVDFFGANPSLANDAFTRVFAACAAQPSCAQAYPDSRGALTALFGRLDTNPPRITLRSGQNTELTPFLVLSVLHLMLYSSQSIPYVPTMIAQMVEGKYQSITALLSDLSQEDLVSYGMYFSVVCQDEVPFTSRANIEAAAQRLEPHFAAHFASTEIFDACALWNVPASPASENQPIQSSTPALVIAGEFDPVTPPAYAVQVAAVLSASQQYTLSGESHGASLSECGSQLVQRFLNDPESTAKPSCVSTLASVNFFTQSVGSPFATAMPEGADLGRLARLLRNAARRQGPR